MEDNRPRTEDLSAWNLSYDLIQQIGALLKSSSVHYRNGDPLKCFFDVREIKLLIYSDLSQEEVDALTLIENDFWKIRRIIQSLQKKVMQDEEDFRGEESEDAKKQIKKFNNLWNSKLINFREYIMLCLSRYGYLISKQKDSQHL